MKSKIIHLAVSISLILTSFFIGTAFNEGFYREQIRQIASNRSRIDLSLSGKTIEILHANKDLRIFLNGKILESGKKLTIQ